MSTKGKIFVGIGGWNFAPWRGAFYPKIRPHRNVNIGTHTVVIDRALFSMLISS